MEISNSQDSFEFYNGIVFGQDDRLLANCTKNKGGAKPPYTIKDNTKIYEVYGGLLVCGMWYVGMVIGVENVDALLIFW